jgi:hypothetical protein
MRSLPRVGSTRFRSGVLVLAVVAVAACSSVAVYHDYDVEADFTRYKTYQWVPSDPDSTLPGTDAALASNTLLDRRIRDAVDAAMGAHGFTIAHGDPDLLVAYHTGLKDRMEITDWGYTYSGEYAGWVGRDVDVQNFTEGTLIIDLITPDTRQLVWRGTATGEIHPGSKPEERNRAMKALVARMFEDYPPRR